MRSEDRPPERIWLDDDALSAHFEAVNARYANPREADDVGALTQNELTAGLRGR